MFRFSLTGLLVLIALLYFTGAGKFLWEKIHYLNDDCFSLSERIGATASDAVCGAVNKGVEGLDVLVQNLQGHWQEWWGNMQLKMPGLFGDMDYGSFGERLLSRLGSGTTSLAGFASPWDRLRGLSMPESGGGMRAALDNFVMGQRLLQSNSAAQALPWLQQGASQQGYGVMSQLSLGSLYEQGGGGVEANPLAAAAYYQQAQNSIASLMQADTPESRQLLGNLPASPQLLQQQLGQTINQLKAQAARR